ncbi:MAG TPA: hypothetical protein VKV27_06665 [Solirubrobacteraceae bacterium]|nr:hypothetical protein [Solirubrobacteraceae bacterium]
MDQAIADLPIPGYLGWVAMNISADGRPRAILEADLERATRCGARAAADAVSELVALGLLDAGGALTATGLSELRSARERIGAITRSLVADIAETDLALATDVLDRVRDRAETLLQVGA